MKPIIKVENLSKKYQLGASKAPYSTLRESLVSAVKFPLKAFQKNNALNGKNTLWALKDVSFEVMPGGVVGIIGRNGAGKSTLLKVLSRITEPTTGKVELYGRIASLLEVGTGFHPELTGRENVFLNGAILGMQRGEIAKKFDEIIDFAEIEKFVDTPVKFYSSGMYMRLAFAVAAHLEPEILVVDEVLAVGDAEFQKKCLGKMKDVSEHGRTVLFVSHNITAIKSLCTTAIYLQNGQIVDLGDVQKVVDNYISGESLSSKRVINLTKEGFTVEYIEFIDDDIPGNFSINEDLTFNIKVRCEKDFNLINTNLFFNTIEGEVIFATCSTPKQTLKGEYLYQCKIPANTLNDNMYSISLMIVKDSSSPLLNVDNVLTVQGIEPLRESAWMGKFPGLIRPIYFDWSRTKINEQF